MVLHVKIAISSTKKTKQQCEPLFKHEMSSCIQGNISFIALNDFLQTLSFCFVMPSTSKHKYQCFLILVQSFRACTFSRIVWFQEISTPPPRRELKIPGGGDRGPGNSRGEGGWTIKSLSRGKYHFVFDLSSNIASYRTGGSFLGHK